MVVTSPDVKPQGDAADIALSAQARKFRNWHFDWKIFALRVLVVVAVLLLWQFISGHAIPEYAISKPTVVWKTLTAYVQTSAAWEDIRITLIELVLGYAFGILGGAIVGVLLAYWKIGARIFEPMITAVNGIPKVALAPLFLIMLGLGIWSKVAIASMTVFFVMFYNMYYGVRSIPPQLTSVVLLIGGSKLDILRTVVLPGSMPAIIAGLKAGVPFALIGVVVGEFIASDEGVGYYINNQTQQFNAGGTFTGIIILVIIALILNSLAGLLERVALRWQRGN
jgi:NitT/TauT family transport system permease protein